MPFRTDRLLPVLALVAALAYATQRDAVVHAKPSPRVTCSMASLPGRRDTLTNTLLLGRGTRDTVPVSGDVVDWWSRRDRTLYGQVVRMDSMLGPAADPTRRALRRRRSVD